MHKNFINGRLSASRDAGTIAVLNPSNGKSISTIPDSSTSDVDAAIEAARTAQVSWGKLPAIARAGHLRQIAQRIRSKADEIARVISEEQGKILPLAAVEANFTVDYLDYMAEWARRVEGEILPSDRENENIFLFRQPIGVVGGILPWNFPFFLIARKMAPALLAGNTIVIKPSELTPNNAALFVDLVRETELPAGVFNIVYGTGKNVGHHLAGHPGIGMISFTGSVETGSAIMSAAAKNITKVNLELGGKAPAIVAADANIDLAVSAITSSRVINTGQVCNCAERVYVDRTVADEFVSKVVNSMKAVQYGDPLSNASVGMGPLITDAAATRVESMVERAVAGGAKLLTGGHRDNRGGDYFFEPTVLENCAQDSEIMRKEIFGPVLPIHIVDGLDEAFAKGNDSVYGLTSSIYTSSADAAMRAAKELNFGETYINRENFEAMQGFHAGARRSGIGGADGKHGLLEYTRTHVVYQQMGPAA